MRAIPRRSVAIRAYETRDARVTLEIFVRAVTETAAADYGPEQRAAWLGGGKDLTDWNRSLAQRKTFVAVTGGTVVGFSDVDGDGYIHMLFVSPDCGRRGVATALLGHAEHRARLGGAAELTTNASLTAMPFFRARDFVVVEERTVVRDGVRLQNARMRKDLSA